MVPGPWRLRVTVATYRFNNDLRYGAADHARNTQFTPPYVLALIRDDLGGTIHLDPCTTADNPTRAVRFFTAEEDGLSHAWWYPSVFVNPPYGKAREPWVEQCIETARNGHRVILLIPAATETRIFQRAAETSTAIVFVQGRLKFGVLRPNRRQVAASHGSALIGWNVKLDACATLGYRASNSQDHP